MIDVSGLWAGASLSATDWFPVSLAGRHLCKWLWCERRRNSLSVIGFVIGVAASTVALSVQQGEAEKLKKALRLIGASTLSVAPEAGALPILGVSEVVSGVDRVREAALVSWSTTEIRTEGRSTLRDVPLLGVEDEFFSILERSAVRGRRISRLELERGAPVAMVGSALAKHLGARDVLVWKGLALAIVGFLDAPVREGVVRTSLPSILGEALVVPRSFLAGTRFSSAAREVLLVEAKDAGAVQDLKEELEAWMKSRYAGPFAIESVEEALRQERATRGFLAWSLVAVGGISLLLGGAGLMNNMLALVLERKAEIGLRRALGASKKEVGLQFLAEGCIVALGGCACGALVGVAAVPVLSWFGVACRVAFGPVVIPPAVGVVMGVLAGVLPALRAATAEPIEGLRPLG